MVAEPKLAQPRHLRPGTRRWFGQVLRDYELEPYHIGLLLLVCEAWDRGQQAREVLEEQGLTFVDRFGQPRARPEVAIERDSRVAFARLLREMDIDGEPGPSPRRPPTLPRNRRED